LRRCDIDVNRRLMTVRERVREVDGHLLVSPTKSSAVRTVTLPDSLCVALGQRLDELPADQRTVVCGSSRGAHRRPRIQRRDSWDPAAPAADIKATPHDLRATCASHRRRRLRQGRPTPARPRRTDHAPSSSTPECAPAAPMISPNDSTA
jgi:integrase